jgi:hypothetical protein
MYAFSEFPLCPFFCLSSHRVYLAGSAHSGMAAAFSQGRRTISSIRRFLLPYGFRFS